MSNPWVIGVARHFLQGNPDMQLRLTPQNRADQLSDLNTSGRSSERMSQSLFIVRIVSGLVLAALLLMGTPTPVAASVGKTAGSFGVSSTGSANYSIPIWAPSGPRGLQPHMAVVYTEQGGGSMGVGWSLTGLSAITRCNKTLAQDGAAAPVTLTYNDAFCIDGQRLRLTSSDTLST
jgi:hypothetical protein